MMVLWLFFILGIGSVYDEIRIRDKTTQSSPILLKTNISIVNAEKVILLEMSRYRISSLPNASRLPNND